ncbi:MAG: hypothetical protein CR982_10520 [Candidatus Cloacimonadota bacterium]|nr:MAG: hypothetical protein CR982_10520 [Candidatus Cloacimonadota bacterium]PIE78646.1 MAG: hypothetical protein CSA15_07110 [Candidatus Delongbacteria bacterium]
MRKIVINLVGFETIPNIAFIRSIDRNSDTEYIFLTTKQMIDLNKTDSILSVCNPDIVKKSSVKIIPDNNFNQILSELKDYNFDDESEIFINLTGGTKIMAMAVFEYFKPFPNCKFYYSDIRNTDYFENILNSSDRLIKKDFLTVEEYLKSYGNENINIDDKPHDKELTFKLFNITDPDLQTASDFIRYVHEKMSRSRLELKGSGKNRKKKRFEIYTNKHFFESFNRENNKKLTADALLKTLSENNFSLEKEKVLNEDQRKYFNGCWFEEYTYHLLDNFIKEIGGNIIKGAIINRNVEKKAENELDICFTYKNRLYTIENKFSIGKESFNNYIYKLQAIRKDLGLTPQAYIATMDTKDKIDKFKTQHKRLSGYKIGIITKEYFENDQLLIDFFRKELNLIKR